MKNNQRVTGFTLLELMTVLVILVILAGISIPFFSTWLPDQRLKSAARDLFSNMKLAKMMAIKSNSKCRIIFSTIDEDSLKTADCQCQRRDGCELGHGQ